MIVSESAGCCALSRKLSIRTGKEPRWTVVAMFIIRVFKSWGTRDAERRWVNNYEVEAGALGVTALDAVAEAIADAERVIHLNQVHFLSATISTWAEDSTPYNPLAFRTIELDGTGTPLVGSDDPVDSNVCLLVKFQAATGRSGRRFYRGVLTEADMEIGGDARFNLEAASPVRTRFNQAGGYAELLAPYLSGGADPVSIVLAAPNLVGVQREVESVEIGGIVVNRRNHRYFDRAA
jgi:hypothetical protein